MNIAYIAQISFYFYSDIFTNIFEYTYIGAYVKHIMIVFYIS